MIQITAYLRDEADKAKWDAIPRGKKAEWLHIALNEPYDVGYVHGALATSTNAKKGIGVVDTLLERERGIIKTLKQAKSAGFEVAQATDTVKGKSGTCPIHKIPLDDRGKCLQKGCKYA